MGGGRTLDEARHRNPDIRFLQLDAEDPVMTSLGRGVVRPCFLLRTPLSLRKPNADDSSAQGNDRKTVIRRSSSVSGDEPMMALVEESQHEGPGPEPHRLLPNRTLLTQDVLSLRISLCLHLFRATKSSGLRGPTSKATHPHYACGPLTPS